MGLELAILLKTGTRIQAWYLPLPPNAGINGICHHAHCLFDF